MQKLTQLWNGGVVRHEAGTAGCGATGRGRRWATSAIRIVLAGMWFALMAQCALAVQTTTVADTVYLANGSVASGTVLISWPTFTTAAGQAVPSGNTSVVVGANGALNVALAPNAGAAPAGVYYTVVMHLNGGATTTEYWVVPATTTTTLSAIRSKMMPVTRAVPIGIASTSGLVLKAGDTMQGPLTLSGDPIAPLQASSKNYVDAAIASQQSLIGAAATAASSAQTAATAAQTTASGASTTAASAQATASSANATAIAAQTTANGALPKSGGALTGKVTLSNGLLANRSDVVDVIADCGLPTDGVTDSLAAMNACITAHPTAIFFFPVPRGLAANVCHYFFSGPVTMGAAGVRGTGNGYNANPLPTMGTNVCFAKDQAGFIVSTGLFEKINVIGGNPAPRQGTIGDTPTLIYPAGGVLDEYREVPVSLARTGGGGAGEILTIVTSAGQFWQVNGLVQIVGATDASFNGVYRILTAVAAGQVTYTASAANQPDATTTPTGSTFLQSATTGPSSGDGLVLQAGTTVRDVSISNFARDCIRIDGNFIADDFKVEDSYMTGCRMNGFHVSHGSDTSAGTTSHLMPFFNMGTGILDTNFLGDIHIAPEASFNHGGGFVQPAGNTVAIASITSSSNVVTVATSTAHGFVVGNGVVITGTSTALDISPPVNATTCTSVAATFNGLNGNNITCTTSPHTLLVGQKVLFSGNSHTSWNIGGAAVTPNFGALVSAVPDNTHFTAGWVIQDIATGTGGTITPLNLSCFVATVPDATHFTCQYPHGTPNVSAATGTVRLGSQPEVFLGAGFYGGSYAIGLKGFSGHNKLEKAYSENAQGLDNMGAAMRFNQTVLVNQLHSGDTIDPQWPGSTIQSDSNGMHASSTNFDITANTFSYKFGGNTVFSVSGAGDVNVVGVLTLTKTLADSGAVVASGVPTVAYPSSIQLQEAAGIGIVQSTGTASTQGRIQLQGRTSVAGATTYLDLQSTGAQLGVPLQFNSSSTAITQSTVFSPSITPTAVAATSCSDQTVAVTGLLTTDMLSQIAPPAALGNVSMSGYASAANTLTLHFCNPSAASVTPPAGVYTFRATH